VSQCFSLGTHRVVSSTNETYHRDKAEILLKVSINTLSLTIPVGILHKQNVRMIKNSTRMNCFRYLKLISPLNATICATTYLERQKCYGPGKKLLFKKLLFDLEVKGQGPTKVITVRDTPPYGHAPTYQI
jgi:hypothetical protein